MIWNGKLSMKTIHMVGSLSTLLSKTLQIKLNCARFLDNFVTVFIYTNCYQFCIKVLGLTEREKTHQSMGMNMKYMYAGIFLV